jgi:hypothetical protein
MATKPTLTLEEIESQTALELPERDMLALISGINVILLNGVVVFIPIRIEDVAVQVCANLIASGAAVDCDVVQ